MDAQTAGRFNQLALGFAVALLLTTGLALFLPREARLYLFLLGVGVIFGAYVAGGGVSIRTPPSTPIDMSTTFARAEADIRFGDRNVNWNMIYGGFIVGSALAVAGIASLFL